jgi:hypothetical protein
LPEGFINPQVFSSMDPKLLALLGDVERLIAGDQSEIEKVYRFLPELDKVRKSGYDIVGRLVELANKLRSENVSDLAVAVGVMMNVMFGRQISEEDAKKIGAIIDTFKCVKFEEGWVSIDNECLNTVDAPEELKDRIKMATFANFALSAVWSE